MIYTVFFFDLARDFNINNDEYLYLSMVLGLSMQEKTDFWCIATNDFIAKKLGITTRTVQNMSEKLEAMDLLVRAPGTRKRVSQAFSDAILGAKDMGREEFFNNKNTKNFHPKREKSSPQNTKSFHPEHEKFSPQNTKNFPKKDENFSPNNNKYNNIDNNNYKQREVLNERNDFHFDDRSGNHPSHQQPGKKTAEAEQLTDHLPSDTKKPFSEKEKSCAKKEKSSAKKESQSVPLPFGEKFAEVWAEWKAEKKSAHKFTYTERGEKAALAKLVNEAGTEKVAIAMIEQAIAHGWQGIYGLKQDKQPARIAASQESIDSLTDRSRWTIAKHVDDADLPF